MENKLNIAELLKDCPKGMELYSTIYGTVYFDGVRDTGYAVLIDIKTSCNTEVQFYPDGKFNTYYSDSEMTLFPSKDVRTWEGFQRPFKDGDVVFSGFDLISIFKEQIGGRYGRLHSHVSLRNSCVLEINKDNWTLENIRFATEEERQKLFDAIKANGFRWNAETKTLEKLVNPNFKVGNMIKKRGSNIVNTIAYIYNDSYGLYDGHLLFFKEQDDYELVTEKFDISTLNPFDKVLVRDSDKGVWFASLFSHKHEDKYYCICSWYWRCIPYEKNEHLIGTTTDCDNYYKTWE